MEYTKDLGDSIEFAFIEKNLKGTGCDFKPIRFVKKFNIKDYVDKVIDLISK